MDERYKTHNIDISKWLNSRKRVYTYFPELEKDLEKFFVKNGCISDTQGVYKANHSRITGFTSKGGGNKKDN